MTQSSNQLKFAANKAKDVLVSQGVKNVFHVGKSGEGCSQKDNA